jgi:hypothetical protein
MGRSRHRGEAVAEENPAVAAFAMPGLMEESETSLSGQPAQLP